MWSENQATFLANALAPAEVTKIFLYEEKNKVEVVIPDEQLSLAIGRKGQNVKLASNLTNLEIDGDAAGLIGLAFSSEGAQHLNFIYYGN